MGLLVNSRRKDFLLYMFIRPLARPRGAEQCDVAEDVEAWEELALAGCVTLGKTLNL